jgi:transposase
MEQPLFTLPEANPSRPIPVQGKPRLEKANRQQIEMRMASLDDLLPEDHRARMVWEMTQAYDMSSFYADIASVEGAAGRPAIDPHLLLAVWLYAIVEGVGSARALARLCEEHLAYQWLLGGVSVNYHTLADFRVQNEEKLDQLLTYSVAALIQEGLVDLERTAQDGVRIRASAGSSSFRRKETLEKCLQEAEERVQQLKQTEEEDDGQSTSLRQKAARQRHALEKVERVKKALQEVEKVADQKEKNRESRREQRPARASATDPETRIMKMPDGGYRPAFNGQLNVDMTSRIIVGVEMSNEGDTRLLVPMLDQTEERYGELMDEHYVDGGFRSNAGVTAAGKRDVKVFTPIPRRYCGNSPKPPYEVLPSDSEQVAEWKRRMVQEEAKTKYKDRASTVEWANALLRNRGLYQFAVRTIHKARSVLLLYTLVHNMFQTINLRGRCQEALG